MYLPQQTQITKNQNYINVFGGYNHQARINDSEFYEMKNMTADQYPVLSSRDPRNYELQIASSEYEDIEAAVEQKFVEESLTKRMAVYTVTADTEGGCTYEIEYTVDDKLVAEYEQKNEYLIRGELFHYKGTGTYENQTAERSGGLPELERLTANRTGIDITRKSGLDHNANGSFAASTMTMLLSENAQNEYTALIHELGEFGLAYDREGMKNLQESLTRYWVSKEGITGMNDIDSLINEYQRRYSAVEGSKTRSQAMDEIVNDALGGLFSTDEGVQEFAEWLKKDSGYTKGEQKTIVQRFIDTMDSIIKYLKTKLKDMSLTKAARKALELDRQQAEDVRKQFLNVLDHAIKKANTTGEYQSEANSGKKYSLDVDVDDELAYFGVENKLNDYIGVQKAVISKLNEEEDYFGDYVNESTGMIITLGKKGIKETLSSGKRFQTQPETMKKSL